MIKKIVICVCGLLLIIGLAMVGHAEYLEVASRAALYAATIDHLKIDNQELEELVKSQQLAIAKIDDNHKQTIINLQKSSVSLINELNEVKGANDSLKQTIINLETSQRNDFTIINKFREINDINEKLKETNLSLNQTIIDLKAKYDVQRVRSDELIADFYKLNAKKNADIWKLEMDIKEQQQITISQHEKINLLIEKLRVLSDKTADTPKVRFVSHHWKRRHRHHHQCHHR